jgi:hypothetical protein
MGPTQVLLLASPDAVVVMLLVVPVAPPVPVVPVGPDDAWHPDQDAAAVRTRPDPSQTSRRRIA